LLSGLIIFQTKVDEPQANIIENNSSLIVVSGNMVTTHQTAKIMPDLVVLGTLNFNYDVYYMLAQHDWNVDVAYEVMKHESRFNPEAYNPEGHEGCRGSFGAMQISCVHFGKYGFTQENKYDLEENIRVAYEIYKASGWHPWGVCKPPNQKVVCW